MSTSTTTSTEARALKLLGQGLGPEIVASAVGVSVSRISQLLSDPIFLEQVAELRFSSLSKHSERDNAYDKTEDELIEKFRDCMAFMIKPMEILKSLQVINSLKRRGSSTPEHLTNQQTVIQLTLPTQIFNNFTAPKIELNINNQVVKAGEQDLVTIQSANMMKLLESTKIERKNHVLTIENTSQSNEAHN